MDFYAYGLSDVYHLAACMKAWQERSDSGKRKPATTGGGRGDFLVKFSGASSPLQTRGMYRLQRAFLIDQALRFRTACHF